MDQHHQQLWGGRFQKATNFNLLEMNSSLAVDSRLFAEDIDGSKAYAQGLLKAGILLDNEYKLIHKGLERIRYEWIEGLIQFAKSDEDVHTVNERRLIELIGPSGAKLHTGRSRNDQIATDMRIWMRKAIRETLNSMKKTVEAAIALSEKNMDVIMPGYTHLQRAQPVLFSHWVLSHATALKEDCDRVRALETRTNILPLGSGAIAGNPFNIDRNFLAQELKFSGVTTNSMQAVADRDFIVEFIFTACLIGLHLSRLAEDLIVYSTAEFNFVRLSEEYSTGSSLMPQKRNPDSLELIRGMSGSVFGNLAGIMMTIKGTPSTYNKDLQYDKKYMFDSFDILKQTLRVTEGILASLEIRPDVMKKGLDPSIVATDLAYYLVQKDVPFRNAHHYVGQVVAYAETMKVEIDEIPLNTLKTICCKFDDDVRCVFDTRENLNRYTTIGGTSPHAVQKQLETLKTFVSNLL